MRRHNLLLSLLALLFAVFMTACDNGTTNNAKASIGDGGDQGGGAITPTLSISYKIDEKDYKRVYFTGRLDNANEEDYNFTWSFGDDVVSPESSLTIDHVYTIDRGYGVTLAATPKDPEKTPAIANATTTVTISQSGIHIQTLRYSALSGMEYEFQAIATTTDGSQVLYTWDFGDGTIIENTPQNAMTHRYTKYNTEYTVKVSVEKQNAGNTGSVEFPEIKIKTHGVTAQLTIDDDINKKTFKIMSVNIYDETGALIHGYSDAEGEVTGLDNVTYTWDFGDNKPGLTTNERVVEYTYGAATGTYEVSVTITSDSFAGSIPAKGTANVEVSYALTGLRAELGGQYGTVLTVVAEGNGGETYANQSSIYYEITYPNGSKAGQSVSHNESGVGTHTFTKDLDKYFNTYNIKVEAKANNRDGEVLATKTVTVEKPSFRYVLNGPNNGDNGYFSKSFNVTVAENSFELKGAYYDWSLGDGTTRRTQVPNTSHTYAGPGSKTVTVTINSDMLNGLDLTVPDLAKTFTINADVTINTLECPNAGAGSNFLQFNCRVTATGTAGTTLNYKWYKNGQAVSGCAGPYCEHTFDTYNRNDYSVKVEVSVQGSNSAPKSQTAPITTPNAQVTITGPAKGIHGQDAVYTATTKVTHNNSTKNITLTNARYNFRLVENTNSSKPQTANKWTFNFRPDDNEYTTNGAVTRTVYAEVTADNLNGKITSNRVATRITKPAATMQDFNQPVITCSPKTGVNQVRQVCKMTVQVKDTGTITGQFSEYRAKFMYNGTQKVLNFKAGNIVANAKGTTNEFVIDYNWPNNGDITTGASQQQSYVVTGEFYKNGAENDKLTARQANITITLNGDYTLFPLPDTTTSSNSGGSGYRFGTWTCGYNESAGKYSSPNCGSNGSTTLNLGNLANNNGTGTLKETLNFEWHMRINSLGTSLPDTVIKSFTVNKGQKPTDENLRFNIAKTLRDRNIKYTGSVYGQSNVFYLKIYSTNANVLAKPIKIWYNGSNKTGQANRLRKITPLMSTNGYNSCTIRYQQGGRDLTAKYVKFHVTSAKLLFAKFDPNSNIVQLIPTGENYKPFFRFSSTACGANNVCNSAKNDTKATNITNAPGGAEVGWYLNSNAGTVLSNKATITDGLNSGTSTMKLIVKDMLQGSGGAEITDYYPVTECSGIFN